MRPDAMRPRSRPRPERVRLRLRPRPNDSASRPHGQPENNAAIWIYCVGRCIQVILESLVQIEIHAPYENRDLNRKRNARPH